ncbi:MAG: ABC transporter substrate-binding protein [Bacteroidetes bacterium]|nr:ABC transporter substrate-binding protein [Bacteroidota bacterium]MCL5027054.1 ABC transporter substrate-binding protein [Chloroflexota bacterium]
MSGRTTYRLFLVVVLTVALGACAPSATPVPGGAATAVPPKAAPASPTAIVAPAASPQPTAAAAPKIKRGGTVRVAQQADFLTLDPQISAAGPAGYVALYDNMFTLKQDPATKAFEAQPELIESQQTVDPKTLIWKLRRGVKFHDGSNWDAAAAKWNLDRMRTHPKSQVKESVQAIDSVDVVDDYTIKLNLKAPSASLPTLLTPGAMGRTGIVSKAAVDKLGEDEFGRHPSGTGPFQFVEWLTGDHLTLKKFDGYWRKGADGQPLPYLDGAVFRFIPDTSVSLLELKSGNVDVVDRVEPKDVPGVKSNPELVYQEMPWAGPTLVVGFNPLQAAGGSFWNNKKARQAALYAIDRDAMAKTLGLGIGQENQSFWAPGQVGYDPSVPRYQFDRDKAKQLLAEAGYPNGIDTAITVIARPEDLRNAEVLKQMWDAVNIRTKIDNLERLAWIDKVTKAGNFQVATWRYTFYVDPDLYTRSLTPGGSSNWAGWSNPDMSKCMADGRSEYDLQKRAAIYQRCQRIIYDDSYLGLTWFSPANFAYRKNVKDVRLQWDIPDVRDVWLDK